MSDKKHGNKRTVLLLILSLVLIAEATAIVLLHRRPEQTLQKPAEQSVETQDTVQPEEAAQPETQEETAQTEPVQEPEPVPDALRAILEQMTPRDKICQMLFAAPSDITGVAKVIRAGESTRKALEKYPVGGLFYDSSNMQTQRQLKNMLETSQSYAAIPMLFACDEEGGVVNRLMTAVGTTRIDSMLKYKDEGVEGAARNAETIATDMRGCGFNMDFAPVADVWSNPQNKVIGSRAYSTDFAQAAELIPAAVEGFHKGGVACTLKHFPGHGDTSADSHYGAVYIDKPLDQLRSEEFLPFRAGIEAGADAVMIGHLIVRELGDEPAPFSSYLLTDVLRGELGFEGVIITDSLRMQALKDHYTSAEIAVNAVKAGVDMLLCPTNVDAAIEALENAVAQGEIPESRLDESVLRILRLKQSIGLLP